MPDGASCSHLHWKVALLLHQCELGLKPPMVDEASLCVWRAMGVPWVCRGCAVGVAITVSARIYAYSARLAAPILAMPSPPPGPTLLAPPA